MITIYHYYSDYCYSCLSYHYYYYTCLPVPLLFFYIICAYHTIIMYIIIHAYHTIIIITVKLETLTSGNFDEFGESG